MKIYDSDIKAGHSEVVYEKKVTRGTLTIERPEGTFTFRVEVTDLRDTDTGENELELSDIDYIVGCNNPPFDEEEHENTRFDLQRHFTKNPIEVLIAWQKTSQTASTATA